MEKQSSFEGWALVEAMGHQSHRGMVTTEAFGSVVMFRVVTPEIPKTTQTTDKGQWLGGEWANKGSVVEFWRDRKEVLIGAGSIYRITPMTEADAVDGVGLEWRIVTQGPGEERALPAASNISFPDEDED